MRRFDYTQFAMERPSQRWAGGAVLWLGLAGLAAAALMYWVTAVGIGVTPDSTVYLDAAASLRAGHGVYAFGQPLTHYPPLYPVLLAAAGALARDVLSAARLLQSLLFGANAALLGWIAFVSTRRSAVAAAGAVLLFSCSAAVLSVHAYVWSEGAFLFCVLAGLATLSSHIQKPRPWRLVVSSLLIGLALGIRYVGVSLVPPAALALLFLGPRPLRARVRDTAVAVLLMCAPLGVWIVRNLITAGSGTNRQMIVHLASRRELEALIVTLHDLFLPVAVPGWLKALDLAVLAGIWLAWFAWFVRDRLRSRTDETAATSLPALSIAFSAVYVVVLFVSISFFDVTTTLDSRILAPVFVCLAAASLAIARGTADRHHMPIMWWAGVAALSLCVVFNAARATTWAIETHRDGLGFTSRAWRNSPTMDFARSLSSDVTIYSNDPPAIRFLTGRPALMIPLDLVPMTGAGNPAFKAEMEAMCRAFRDEPAVLLWFTRTGPWFARTREAFTSSCPVAQTRTFADGTAYGGSQRVDVEARSAR